MPDLAQEKKKAETEIVKLSQEKLDLLNRLSELKIQIQEITSGKEFQQALERKLVLDKKQAQLDAREEAISVRETNIEKTIYEARETITILRGGL